MHSTRTSEEEIKHRLDHLIKELVSYTDKNKQQVINELLNLKSPFTAELLIYLLNDKDSRVREAAAQILGRIKDYRAITPLIKLLKDEQKSVRRSAVLSLGKFRHPQVIAPLFDALRDDDLSIRVYAMRALSGIDDSNVIWPLIHALSNETPQIRWMAAEALKKFRDTRIVNPLIHALKDKSWSVREEAARTLAELKDIRSIKPLIEVLTRDINLRTRVYAARALGRLQHRWGVQPLIYSLREVYNIVNPQFWEVQDKFIKEIIESLLMIGEPAVEPLLEGFKDEDPRFRRNIIVTLGRIADKHRSIVISSLLEFLKMKNEFLKEESLADVLDCLFYLSPSLEELKPFKNLFLSIMLISGKNKTVINQVKGLLQQIMKN
ncbi:MAG: HEAT repeat domain-containing protein [Promethearchaeota archaeon]